MRNFLPHRRSSFSKQHLTFFVRGCVDQGIGVIQMFVDESLGPNIECKRAAAGLSEGRFLAAKGRKQFLPAPTQTVLCNCAQEACLMWDRFDAARSVAVP